MKLRPLIALAASFSLMAATLPVLPAFAGGSGYSGGGSSGHGPGCKTGGGGGYHPPSFGGKNISIYKPVNINNNINIYKPVNIVKNINENKNININNNININKNINVNNNVNINKNINDNKNININKNIVINNGGGGSAEAAAFAIAGASASSNSSSQANVAVSSGSYSESVTINQGGGTGGAVAVAAEEVCHETDATVVKAIHAVCVAGGREFPASHMLRDTWIESSYEGEVARCIPGATLKVTIGDMVQSDQGMAGAYAGGQVLNCAAGEAVRHFKDGMLKCVRAVPVKDCTERTNLRLYGTGDFFFSYRTQVCATSARSADAQSGSEATASMSMDGGVGQGSQY